MTEQTIGSATQPPAEPRKAALAAWIGSMLEYYDFFIYGTAAALVFGKVFFPDSSPAVGTLLSLATYGVGYVARPLGGIFWGHIGDTLGRKKVLLLTLSLMGASTFLVGCVPSYRAIGVVAPVLLVTLRLLQGFSAGGEQAGANSMSLEHAPDGRRAFFTSFTLSGTQTGQIVATGIFLLVARLPDDQLQSWGWRVPFLLSAIIAVVGYFIRRRLSETPVFALEVEDEAESVPVVALLRDQPLEVLRVTLAALIASVSTIFTVYALSYAVNTVGFDDTPMLWVGVCANVAAVISIPLWARLSDRIGRKPLFIGGALASALFIFPYLHAISTHSNGAVFLFGIVLFGIGYAAANAVWPSLYGEMFTARVRLSGMAIGTQIGFAIAGFIPTVATSIEGTGKDAWLPVAVLTAAICLVSAAAIFTARETFNVRTADLGRKQSAAASKSAVTA